LSTDKVYASSGAAESPFSNTQANLNHSDTISYYSAG